MTSELIKQVKNYEQKQQIANCKSIKKKKEKHLYSHILTRIVSKEIKNHPSSGRGNRGPSEQTQNMQRLGILKS